MLVKLSHSTRIISGGINYGYDQILLITNIPLH